MLKKITGLDCPGCGTTRALHSLLHGEISKAADYNLLFLILLSLLFMCLLEWLIFRGVGIWNKVNSPVLFTVFICIFWVLRNIDRYPFSYLHSAR